jgi:hypothetical protein
MNMLILFILTMGDNKLLKEIHIFKKMVLKRQENLYNLNIEPKDPLKIKPFIQIHVDKDVKATLGVRNDRALKIFQNMSKVSRLSDMKKTSGKNKVEVQKEDFKEIEKKKILYNRKSKGQNFLCGLFKCFN